MKRRLFILFCLCAFGMWPLLPAVAASVQFQEIPVEYTFGEQVLLRVQIQSDISIKLVTLSYRYEGLPDIYQVDALLSPENQASYTILTHQAFIPAFSTVEYWFAVQLNDGSTATSPSYSFEYFDHRFEWKPAIEALPLRIHWYNDEPTIGQTLLDVARQGLEKINRLIGVQPMQDVDLYVYDNALDMQSTLSLSNAHWVAGHADPWLGVVVVALPPGPNQLELARQRIPHELMHILLYQHIGAGYENLPTWLNEGLSSMAELENNPDYYTILQKAHEQGISLPLAGLCDSFPQEASNAFLAYAEAEVFTRYLYEQFGSQKMQELITAYADGMACERAPEVVLGKTLLQLDAEWQGVLFNENILAVGLQEMAPWLVLLIIALFSPLLLIAVGPARWRKS